MEVVKDEESAIGTCSDLAPQAADQGQRFPQAGEALFRFRPFHSGGGNFVEPFAGADAQDDPSGKHDAQGAEDLRDDRGVIAEGGRQHAGAYDDALRAGTECAEPRQHGRRMPVGMFPGLEMVADENGIKTIALGLDREVQQRLGGELLRRRFVAEFQHNRISSCQFGSSQSGRTLPSRPAGRNRGRGVETRPDTRQEPAPP